MRKLNDNEINELRIRIKNNLDISDIIKNKDIRGLDLSYAIISDFNRIKDDISNCNLSYAIIGRDNIITNLSGTKMINCNFKGAKFLGKVWLRRVDARNSNWSGAYVPYVEYQYADFRGATFCDTIITIGSRQGLGAKFSKRFLDELCKHWILE